eukprot:tig00000350_g24323.t1
MKIETEERVAYAGSALRGSVSFSAGEAGGARVMALLLLEVASLRTRAPGGRRKWKTESRSRALVWTRVPLPGPAQEPAPAAPAPAPAAGEEEARRGRHGQRAREAPVPFKLAVPHDAHPTFERPGAAFSIRYALKAVVQVSEGQRREVEITVPILPHDPGRERRRGRGRGGPPGPAPAPPPRPAAREEHRSLIVTALSDGVPAGGGARPAMEPLSEGGPGTERRPSAAADGVPAFVANAVTLAVRRAHESHRGRAVLVVDVCHDAEAPDVAKVAVMVEELTLVRWGDSWRQLRRTLLARKFGDQETERLDFAPTSRLLHECVAVDVELPRDAVPLQTGRVHVSFLVSCEALLEDGETVVAELSLDASNCPWSAADLPRDDDRFRRAASVTVPSGVPSFLSTLPPGHGSRSKSVSARRSGDHEGAHEGAGTPEGGARPSGLGGAGSKEIPGGWRVARVLRSSAFPDVLEALEAHLRELAAAAAAAAAAARGRDRRTSTLSVHSRGSEGRQHHEGPSTAGSSRGTAVSGGGKRPSREGPPSHSGSSEREGRSASPLRRNSAIAAAEEARAPPRAPFSALDGTQDVAWLMSLPKAPPPPPASSSLEGSADGQATSSEGGTASSSFSSSSAPPPAPTAAAQRLALRRQFLQTPPWPSHGGPRPRSHLHRAELPPASWSSVPSQSPSSFSGAPLVPPLGLPALAGDLHEPDPPAPATASASPGPGPGAEGGPSGPGSPLSQTPPSPVLRASASAPVSPGIFGLDPPNGGLGPGPLTESAPAATRLPSPFFPRGPWLPGMTPPAGAVRPRPARLAPMPPANPSAPPPSSSPAPAAPAALRASLPEGSLPPYRRDARVRSSLPGVLDAEALEHALLYARDYEMVPSLLCPRPGMNSEIITNGGGGGARRAPARRASTGAERLVQAAAAAVPLAATFARRAPGESAHVNAGSRRPSGS